MFDLNGIYWPGRPMRGAFTYILLINFGIFGILPCDQVSFVVAVHNGKAALIGGTWIAAGQAVQQLLKAAVLQAKPSNVVAVRAFDV